MNPTIQPNPNQKPDELVTIVNGKTKQVKQVKRQDLPQYGLPLDYISQADTYAKSVMAGVTEPGAVPEEYRAGAMQVLNNSNFTPKTKDELNLEASRAKAKPDAEAVASGIDNLKKQAKDATLGSVVLSKLSRGNLGVEADIFDQSKKLLGQTIANLYEKGRLSDKDRDFYQNEILKVGAVGRQEAINQKLDNLKTEILRKAGYKPEDFPSGKNEKKNDTSKKGGFIDNALQDTKGIINSVLNIPSEMAKGNMPNPLEVPNFTNPQSLSPENLIKTGKFAVNAAQGTLNEYNQAAGEPLKGGDVAGRIAQRAYEKPVTTALDVLPIIGTAGKVIKGAKGAETVSAVENTPKTSKLPKIEIPQTVKNIANDAGVNAFANNFTIPSKLAPRIKINDVAKTMIENGHTGNLDELGAIADKVTGQNGIFTKLNREAVAQIPEEISIKDAISAGSKGFDNVPQLTARELANHKRIISEIIQPNGSKIGTTNSLDAFDAVQKLEEEGYRYMKSSTKLSPNPVNEKIGKAYLDAADELKMQLEDKSKGTIDALKTPENIAAIEQISPKLAEEFINAKTMADLRKIQSPYVRLKQAIGLTEDASNTPFSKMSQGIARNIGGGAGAMVGSMFGPLGTAAGYAAGQFAEPFIRPIVESTLPRITTKIAQKLKH